MHELRTNMIGIFVMLASIKKRKQKTKKQKMSKILISFSGHKLSEEAIKELKSEYGVIEEVFIPFIDFEKEIEEQLIQIIGKVNYKIDGSRNITIVVPGHSNLSAILFNFLFGLIGHPPDILMFRESEDGNYLPFKKIKGRDLKKAGRLLREKMNNIDMTKNNENDS